ncbi:MAG: response regulator [Sphingomonas sp.]|nr:response regulator [Sphingomonas sp.]
MLAEEGINGVASSDVADLVLRMADGVGFVIATEEALAGSDLRQLSDYINRQPEWSDLPFVLLTSRGGGLERNPAAGRFLELLGNVTFVERPFHPTTLTSVARSALRGRRRQYDARARLESLAVSQRELKEANESLEARVEQRTREREAALAQLHAAQKLETLGQLTGGVAHDFNNLLTPIIGSLDLLRRQLPANEKALRQIDMALQAASRAASLVQRLLAFARRQDLQPLPVDVTELIKGMEDLVSRSIGPMIHVQFDLPEDSPPALIDPNQLELAVLNLAINARDAMPSGGRLRIAVETRDGEPKLDLAPGRYLCLSISDDGVGMNPTTLAHAVEPFFSTKGLGRGTGLGLSMVHGLAAQLGGALNLKSVPGQGTTAEIWLPVTDRTVDVSPGAQWRMPVAPRPATILLVDDEDVVRAATAEMLEDVGYTVVQADSGPAALATLRHDQSIDLLITDYLMPGMNGVDLIRNARNVTPSLLALIISGYLTIAEGPGADIPRLAKPFRQIDLAGRIAEILGSQDATTLKFPDKKERDARG